MLSTFVLVAVVALSAQPAFAGKGAGGVHSSDSSNLAGFNKRAAEEAKPAPEADEDKAEQIEESPESGDSEEMPNDWSQAQIPLRKGSRADF